MNLQKNILNTIVYYDILNFPLTSFEIWKYLTVVGGNATDRDKCTLGEIVEILDGRELQKHVEEFRGFYFLRGRRKLVERRIQNDKNSIAKFKIAERVAKWLRFVPFVRMVAVTGTLAMKNCEGDSDIDFFVALEKERIFTGRFLVTAMVHLLGRRRHGKSIKNRICLNYFVTTGSLEIEKKDLFASNEYSLIYPIFGFDIFKKFCRKNEWVRQFRPNFEFPDLEPARYFVKQCGASRFTQRLFETLINSLGGDRMESWLKKKQIEKIKKNPLTYKRGGYVEYTDENLIFLPEPQGPKIKKRLDELTSKTDFL